MIINLSMLLILNYVSSGMQFLYLLELTINYVIDWMNHFVNKTFF